MKRNYAINCKTECDNFTSVNNVGTCHHFTVYTRVCFSVWLHKKQQDSKSQTLKILKDFLQRTRCNWREHREQNIWITTDMNSHFLNESDCASIKNTGLDCSGSFSLLRLQQSQLHLLPWHIGLDHLHCWRSMTCSSHRRIVSGFRSKELTFDRTSDRSTVRLLCQVCRWPEL